MQYHTFKEVLDGLDHNPDPGSTTLAAHLRSHIDSLAVSMFSPSHSKHSASGKPPSNPGNLYFGAYSESIELADEDIVRSGNEPAMEHSDPEHKLKQQSNPRTGSRRAAHSRSHPMTLKQLRSGLKRNLSIKELSNLRRRFAIENHPDKVAVQERDAASHRLAIANDLIDRAIDRARHRINTQPNG